MNLLPGGAAALLVAACAVPSFAQQGHGTDVRKRINVFKPAKLPATAERVRELKVPGGFRVNLASRHAS